MIPSDLENLLRELAPQVLGALVRRFRNFAAAEDAVQEALLAAATQWPREGRPEHPRAWLVQVASRRFTDQIRGDVARRQRETVAAMDSGYAIPAAELDMEVSSDDTLNLLYLCCHPELTRSSAIALTLSAVGGLSTVEIARAFLVPEATMAQRISRAKQTIKESGVPFRPPTAGEQREIRGAVLHVLYLIFNEGYAASSGDSLQRNDLASEAIRLARLMRASLPRDTEVAGLLALMLLTDARRAARIGAKGEVIPLDKQDRVLWDRGQIEEGVALLSSVLPLGSVGPYQVQAAIAAVHGGAVRSEDTDWSQILALYSILLRMSDNPMVRLNHAVAAAMVHGPATGLELLRKVEGDERLKGHHRLEAVRGHFQEMMGDTQGAISSYLAAGSRTASLPERNFLFEQAARLRAELE